MTLVSSSVNGQIINVTGAVSAAGTNGVGYLANATYTVTGGCLGGDHADLSPFEMLSGTLAGSFQTANGLIGITVKFAAPGLPATNGAYPINGTATFTNAGRCGGFTSAQVQSGTDYEVNKSFTLLTNTGSTITIDGTTLNGLGTQFAGGFAIAGGPCDSATGQIQLNASQTRAANRAGFSSYA